ncbi:MAG TPA: G1 family glutamic endopeptidase [Candidatus Paceibacterota bacterium]|jgi:hypothetical protein|nr:G1 family glutamic endopeptidase [Candidatus Paceibacterota bacterium]
MKKFFAAGIITITFPWSVLSHSTGAGVGQPIIVTQTGAQPQAQVVETEPSQGQAPPALNVPASSDTSYNWAGYVTTAGQTGKQFTSVSGTWTIPTVAAATSTEADTAWVGIGGVTTQDLIQAGTQAVTSPNGTVSYQAWYETLPQTTSPLNINVNPGDSVSVTVAETSAAQWLVSFRDNTTGQNTSENLTYNSTLSSAEWIEEMPLNGNSFVPLDNFGTISFSNATTVENGNTVTISGSAAQPLTMVTNADQTLAAPSALGSDGQSFSVTRSTVPSGSSGGFGFTVPQGRTWRRRVTGVQGFVPRTSVTGSAGAGTGTATATAGFGSGFSFGNQEQILQMLQQMQQQLQAQLNSFSQNAARIGARVNGRLRL